VCTAGGVICLTIYRNYKIVLSRLFLSGQIDLQIGFIMLMVTPCTDWYLIFTGVANGNVPLGASILPLNLILQIVLLPVYLVLFMGTNVSFGIITIMQSILFVLVIPLFTANLIKIFIKKFNRQESLNKLLNKSDDILQLPHGIRQFHWQ
jgi:ACR3 family arsenite efflux pump ArsB